MLIYSLALARPFQALSPYHFLHTSYSGTISILYSIDARLWCRNRWRRQNLSLYFFSPIEAGYWWLLSFTRRWRAAAIHSADYELSYASIILLIKAILRASASRYRSTSDLSARQRQILRSYWIDNWKIALFAVIIFTADIASRALHSPAYLSLFNWDHARSHDFLPGFYIYLYLQISMFIVTLIWQMILIRCR